MAELQVTGAFTQSGGDAPATGLTLADIDIYLYSVQRDDGTIAVIWNTQIPTDEIPNLGHYFRLYSGADLDLYNYHVRFQYTGVAPLDQDMVSGAAGLSNVPIGTAVEFTYTVVDNVANPIEGVKVEIHRNIGGTDVYWVGWTDAFGVARDTYGLKPRLDPSPPDWYFFRFKGGYSFDNPDTETVT